MKYELIWSGQGVTKRYLDGVDGSGIIESTNKIHGDYRFDELRWILIDCRDVTKVVFPNAEIDHLAALYIGAFGSNLRLKIAILSIVPEVTVVIDECVAQINRATHYGDKFRSLTQFDEAMRWLGAR